MKRFHISKRAILLALSLSLLLVLCSCGQNGGASSAATEDVSSETSSAFSSSSPDEQSASSAVPADTTLTSSAVPTDTTPTSSAVPTDTTPTSSATTSSVSTATSSKSASSKAALSSEKASSTTKNVNGSPSSGVSSKTSTASVIADFNSAIDEFSLDLSPSQLLELLKQKNIGLQMPDYSNLPEWVSDPVEDGREYNGSNSDFSYQTDNGLYFVYSADNVLNEITASSAGLPTTEGLQVGDSVNKMESIYGSGYKKNVDDYDVFQYYSNSKGFYLDIFYSGETITFISLRTYSHINND